MLFHTLVWNSYQRKVVVPNCSISSLNPNIPESSLLLYTSNRAESSRATLPALSSCTWAFNVCWSSHTCCSADVIDQGTYLHSKSLLQRRNIHFNSLVPIKSFQCRHTHKTHKILWERFKTKEKKEKSNRNNRSQNYQTKFVSLWVAQVISISIPKAGSHEQAFMEQVPQPDVLPHQRGKDTVGSCGVPKGGFSFGSGSF